MTSAIALAGAMSLTLFGHTHARDPAASSPAPLRPGPPPALSWEPPQTPAQPAQTAPPASATQTAPPAWPAVPGALTAAPDTARGAELRVFLMTMGPGDRVYERFGHNALWVHDPVGGTDKAYNYGLFSFDQPGFVRRFIQGRMDYWMGGYDAYLTAREYQRDNRSVWIQELNLTPAQKAGLQEFLEWNERPENTFYRYDYYRDNCSTRIRDAIDMILGGRIRAATDTILTDATYRSHTRRLTGDDIPIFTGLMVAMGQPIDRPISVWEEMFLPVQMRERFRELTVLDEEGREAPLVLSEETWFEASRAPIPEEPPRHWPGYLMAGLLLGVALGVLGSATPGSRGARGAFTGIATLWLLLVGSLGFVIAALWGFTDHYVTYRNENLLQVHPLALVLAALILAGTAGATRARTAARWLAVAMAAAAVAGVLLKILPHLDQVNGTILVLMVPAHLGLAWGVWRWATSPTTATAATRSAPGHRRARPTPAR